MSVSMVGRFFGVAAKPQSYLNILFLLSGLPLGIAYFVFLVTGLSIGFGLVVIWVGVPILMLVLLGSWALCRFERAVIKALLKEEIHVADRFSNSGDGGQNLSGGERWFLEVWRRLKAHLSDRLTWTGIFYLLLRFPTGIATFVIAVVLISVVVSLLGAPAYYWVDDGIEYGIWQVDELWEALILTAAGIPAVFAALHIMNGTAFVSGRMARAMLGNT